MIPVCAADLPRRLSPGCLPPHLYKTGGNGGLAARLRFGAAFATICVGETYGACKHQIAKADLEKMASFVVDLPASGRFRGRHAGGCLQCA